MKQEENLQNLRHTSAHLLAAAVQKLYPDTKRAIGPAIENGFYYDFEFSKPLHEEDLPKIEEEMKKILKTWSSTSHEEISLQEAKKRFAHEPYKIELIEELAKEGKKLTVYKNGNYEDLCKGGHTDNPAKEIGAVKLLSLAGAYWRGSEKNKMLTRIYGISFSTQAKLDEYLLMLEETKKRDHKKLASQLELFFFDDTAPGMAYWLPKGLILYNTLYAFAREMYKKYDYQEVATPQLNKKELYETSGHWAHYRDDMFVSPMSYLRSESNNPMEGSEVFGLKPMNCPNHMRIFAHKTRSYHELPLRLAETTSLHRFELSGTLNGLFRIRQFRQDDAHIFIYPEQAKQEFESLLKMIEEMYSPFNLTYRFRFGTRPEKHLGEATDWDLAENVLRKVLNTSGKEYFEVAGEGAFYGPKVDILMKDSLGREWQTGTIQLDIQQPKRFDLHYIDSEGIEKMPFVFHRAIVGSFERFLGILIEHYAGAFPLWLAPVQVSLLPIADRHAQYAQKVAKKLKQQGIRVEVDNSSETLQSKIRNATLQKVPFMGIIGDKEIAAEAVSVRSRAGENLGSQSFDDFLQKVKQDIDKKI